MEQQNEVLASEMLLVQFGSLYSAVFVITWTHSVELLLLAIRAGHAIRLFG